MATLEEKLITINSKLGSSERVPSDVEDPLNWYLNKTIELLEQGGGGGGSNYKGVTVLKTGTLINTGEESPTTYEFIIISNNPISSIEEYWGDGNKPCLLIHILNNGETVLTPVLLFSIPDNDSETGGYIYKIQVLGQSSPITFSSVEIQHGNVIEALLDNVQDFEDLEDDLKAGSLIQGGSSGSSSDEILVFDDLSGEEDFTLAIHIPESMSSSEEAFNNYLESAKTILWKDISTGTIYLTPCTIYMDDILFKLMSDNVTPTNYYTKRGTAFFNFNLSDKEVFIHNSIGGGSGGGSSGPNYQVPYGSGAILSITPISRITVKKIEVAEEYKLLKLTYQRVSEEVEPPTEEKVFSIMCENENGFSGENYYVVWDIDSQHYANENTESGSQQSSVYLENYPVIACISYEYRE